MLRAIALMSTCAVLALTAAACGQSASSADGDPASLAPADAPVYAQVAVRPEGQRRDDALAAAGKLLRTDDPAGRLRELFDEGLAEQGGGFTWEKDFAPWIGEEAGIWASNIETDAPSFAAIVQVRDAEAARAALQRAEQDGGGANEKRSHRGVEYQVDADGTASGIVDEFFVIGTEAAFKRTVDVREGGETLADSDRYANAMGELEGDRLGQFYIDSKVLFDAAMRQDPASAQQLEQFKSLFPFDKLGPTAGSFQADGDSLAVDSVLTGLPDGPLRMLTEVFSGGTELMPDLPGDAWSAFAVPKVGEAANGVFTSIAGAIGGAAVAAQVKQATGLDLEQDVFSWVGDVGVFVRGASEPALDGALVIESTDDGKAAAAFGKIIGLIDKEAAVRPEPIRIAGAQSAFSLSAAPAVDKPFVLARGEGRVVAAYGEEGAKAALDPSTRLGDSELYADAKAALADGMEPGFVLSMPAVVALVDAIGQADADYAAAKPYLETLGAITTGGTVDGDTAKSRIAVTLK